MTKLLGKCSCIINRSLCALGSVLLICFAMHPTIRSVSLSAAPLLAFEFKGVDITWWLLQFGL